MEGMKEIVNRILKTRDMTSLNSKDDEYKCSKCKDTGMRINEQGEAYRCECMKKKITSERWKRFGVDPNKVKLIKDYEPNNEQREKARKMAVDYIKSFKGTNTLRENSLAFMGQPGSGKTHLALGIGRALIENGITSVIYMPYLESIMELKSLVFESEEYNDVRRKYTDCGLLIIDDLFKSKVKNGKLIADLTEADTKHLMPIINWRYNNNKPMVINTECTPNMLLDLEEAIAGRILEMCGDKIIVFKHGKENNWRLRNL